MELQATSIVEPHQEREVATVKRRCSFGLQTDPIIDGISEPLFAAEVSLAFVNLTWPHCDHFIWPHFVRKFSFSCSHVVSEGRPERSPAPWGLRRVRAKRRSDLQKPRPAPSPHVFPQSFDGIEMILCPSR